jgi:hypothetical protein
MRKVGTARPHVFGSKQALAVFIGDQDHLHLRGTGRHGGQLAFGIRAGLRALGLVPGDRIAQQQVGGLQRVPGLFRKGLGQVAQLAVGHRDDVAVRMPAVVSGRARERRHGQHTGDDDPEPQARRKRCVRAA